ncbi:hypothetical protein [Ensifer soli]|uniref:hypothetical protein n=1 Tax=Ciceribacter sp. sgz301302 TaxID=3342379 RepID=UPI0035B84382
MPIGIREWTRQLRSALARMTRQCRLALFGHQGANEPAMGFDVGRRPVKATRPCGRLTVLRSMSRRQRIALDALTPRRAAAV